MISLISRGYEINETFEFNRRKLSFLLKRLFERLVRQKTISLRLSEVSFTTSMLDRGQMNFKNEFYTGDEQIMNKSSIFCLFLGGIIKSSVTYHVVIVVDGRYRQRLEKLSREETTSKIIKTSIAR